MYTSVWRLWPPPAPLQQLDHRAPLGLDPPSLATRPHTVGCSRRPCSSDYTRHSSHLISCSLFLNVGIRNSPNVTAGAPPSPFLLAHVPLVPTARAFYDPGVALRVTDGGARVGSATQPPQTHPSPANRDFVSRRPIAKTPPLVPIGDLLGRTASTGTPRG